MWFTLSYVLFYFTTHFYELHKQHLQFRSTAKICEPIYRISQTVVYSSFSTLFSNLICFFPTAMNVTHCHANQRLLSSYNKTPSVDAHEAITILWLNLNKHTFIFLTNKGIFHSSTFIFIVFLYRVFIYRGEPNIVVTFV